MFSDLTYLLSVDYLRSPLDTIFIDHDSVWTPRANRSAKIYLKNLGKFQYNIFREPIRVVFYYV